jgi:hypothetical protein
MDYNFLYKTKNLINGKIYLGVHCTNKINDGYVGNGIYKESDVKKLKPTPFRNAIKKYGYENFKVTVIQFFDNEKDAYLMEANIVTKDFILSKDNYNVSTGGKGGSIKNWMSDTQIEDFKNKISSTWTEERKSTYGKD